MTGHLQAGSNGWICRRFVCTGFGCRKTTQSRDPVVKNDVVVIDDDDVTWQMIGGSNLSVSNRFILGSEVTHR